MIVESIAELYRSNNDKNSNEYGYALIDKQPDLQQALNEVGGWRGLFDILSHEFKICNKATKKWEVIKSLMEFLECGFDGIVYLVAKDWNCLEECYKLDAIPEAVYYYAARFREAEDYLMRCKHPLFRQRKIREDVHWKKAFLKHLYQDKTTFDNLDLLLLDNKN